VEKSTRLHYLRDKNGLKRKIQGRGDLKENGGDSKGNTGKIVGLPLWEEEKDMGGTSKRFSFSVLPRGEISGKLEKILSVCAKELIKKGRRNIPQAVVWGRIGAKPSIDTGGKESRARGSEGSPGRQNQKSRNMTCAVPL